MMDNKEGGGSFSPQETDGWLFFTCRFSDRIYETCACIDSLYLCHLISAT